MPPAGRGGPCGWGGPHGCIATQLADLASRQNRSSRRTSAVSPPARARYSNMSGRTKERPGESDVSLSRFMRCLSTGKPVSRLAMAGTVNGGATDTGQDEKQDVIGFGGGAANAGAQKQRFCGGNAKREAEQTNRKGANSGVLSSLPVATGGGLRGEQIARVQIAVFCHRYPLPRQRPRRQ